MKATARLCSIAVLICAVRLVCTAHQRYNNNNAGGYPLDYADAKLLQYDYLLGKRNKPSLSIVNPLDVLRKRLLLEMARRQMKENTRQVELNRAILKNVGKRMLPGQMQQLFEHPLSRSPYQQLAYEYSSNTPQQLQLQLQQLLQPHYANQVEYAPDVSVYDYLQLPAYIYDTVLGAAVLAESEGVGVGESEGESARRIPLYINALEGVAEDGDTTAHNEIGNEMINETTNYKSNSNSATGGNRAALRQTHGSDAGSSGNVDAVGSSGVLAKQLSGNERLTAKDGNLLVDEGDEGEGIDGNADYQLRYFYGLHKKRHNMKK